MKAGGKRESWARMNFIKGQDKNLLQHLGEKGRNLTCGGRRTKDRN